MISGRPVIETIAEDDQDEPYDSSDPQQVNQAKSRAGRRKKARLDYIRTIMETTAGREWVYGLLLACDTFRTPFEATNEHGTSFRAGKQWVGLLVWADVTAAAPDLYPKMIDEANKRKAPKLHPTDGLSA